MGWWEQSAEGESLMNTDLPQEQKLLWGDGPADVIDNALTKVKVEFLRNVGRMPSKAEIIAGIAFSTRVLDELAETPEHAPHTTPDQAKVIQEHGYKALYPEEMHGSAEADERARSRDAVLNVLRELSCEPDVTYVEVDLETGQQVVTEEPPRSTVPDDYSYHAEVGPVIRGRDT